MTRPSGRASGTNTNSGRASGASFTASRQRGMTLIEILVVLVLIGIVLGIVGGNFIGKGEKAKADAAKIEIGQISQTLDLYKLEVGRYPTTQEGLQALISAPAGVTNWNGPYWKKASVPKDPWGNEYKYTSPAQSAPYEISSLGADGREGGEGPNKDISSSQ
jgi:general secretion pathway protein G